MEKLSKHKKYRSNQRKRKEERRFEKNDNTVREPYYQPPQLRGLRIYGDLDFGYLKLVYISLWDSGRIDSFYIRREKPENIGKRPNLNDAHNGWWVDENNMKKRYGKVNLDKAIRGMFPIIRRMD